MSEPMAVPAEAVKVLQAFLDAGERKDEAAMRACLSRSTLESGKFNPDASPQGARFVFGQSCMEGEAALVQVKILPQGAPDDAEPMMNLPCIIVQEDGAWKLDLNASLERMFAGGELDKVLTDMTEAVGNAMKGIGEAMGDALTEAFGGDGSAGEAPRWDDVPLTPGDEELLPQLEMTKLPATSAAIWKAIGSPVDVLVAMKELLAQMNGDRPDVLAQWFEEQQLVSWGEVFGWVNQFVPLTGRLHAVRIEPTEYVENRGFFLDGSDLVYRIYIGSESGYFTYDETTNLLPGVLAGLPEQMDPALEGKRLMGNDDQPCDFDSYRDRVAPRFMRRISDLLGRPVALEADWSEVSDYTFAGTVLRRWGLGRVYGGIALACLDAARRERLGGELKTIRLAMGMDVGEPFARYTDGVLETGLIFHPCLGGGVYENEIAAALEGCPAAEDEAPPQEPAP